MVLRSIPPITSTGTSPKDIGKRFSEILPKTKKKAKILTGIRGRILGKSFNLGNPKAFNFGERKIYRDNWKPKVFKRVKTQVSKPKITVIRDKEINMDIFDEKKYYQIITQGIPKYLLEGDILTFNNGEKEILIPKDVRLDTLKAEEKNGVLVITFKKRVRRKNEKPKKSK